MFVYYDNKFMDIQDAIATASMDLCRLPSGIPGVAFQYTIGPVDFDSPGVFVICDHSKPRKYKVTSTSLDEAVRLWNSKVLEWSLDFM